MRLFLCLVLPIAVWCAPAALATDENVESLQPLLRVKRSGDTNALTSEETQQTETVANSDTKATPSNANSANSDDVTNSDPEVKVEKTPKQEDLTEDEEDDKKDSKPQGDESDSSSNAIQRKKRENPVMMTAENMGPQSAMEAANPARSKRDLTPEDIYKWLETGEGPQDYYREDFQEYPEYEDKALEDLAEDAYLAQQGYAPEYDEYLPEVPIEEDPSLAAAAAAADLSNEELVEYLLEYLAANEIPESRPPLAEVYPGAVQEEWEEVIEDPAQILAEEEAEEDAIPYEPIVYNGVPGIFIPINPEVAENLDFPVTASKRDYFNLDSGIRKRNDFYPYSLEPEEGRWGAFVDQREEKRNADAYERLLRMAEALNPPEERYYDELDGYKKK